ncbi:methyltransferase [Mesorhizobium sp. B2-6-4]|uniref:methyltransferase n=1 Tax=Mesorhizobium sp. B2-6-4 TaxID=2589913 RepID=UPI001FEED3FC|nr:methyltransferase [Mesorhizobium sp. B2-6-4]
MEFSAISSVIDIGGGPQDHSRLTRKRWPQIAGTLVELPLVSAAAPDILSEYSADGVAFEEGT